MDFTLEQTQEKQTGFFKITVVSVIPLRQCFFLTISVLFYLGNIKMPVIPTLVNTS